MKRIVECVPNFSEGCRQEVIDRIAQSVGSVEGVTLLDVDPGKDTNRTVVTFAGEPERVLEAAFQAIKTASALIDMRQHRGAHARMGATDVCPFVPVSGMTMEECVSLAEQLGERVGRELGIPVYLYAQAARREDRRRLPDIREGEYEALEQKLKNPDFEPDFGPSVFNPKAGATAVGARDFLLAYNVNLNTRDVKIASKIANRVREKGRMVTDRETGKKSQVPGTCAGVQGMGWYIPEYEMAQITVNILNYHETPLWKVFEECERFAAEFGVRVTGSELVGMVPLQALTDVGLHCLQKQGGSPGAHERELVRLAIQSLGLSEIAPFVPEERIVEYRLAGAAPLAAMGVSAFVDELSSLSPAPGGGSVAALAGALSAGLSAMVGNLTVGKKGYESAWEELGVVARKAQLVKDRMIHALDADTAAFNRIMAAFSLPKGSPEEKARRQEALEEATREAIDVPFSVLKDCPGAVDMAEVMMRRGNQNSLSDAGVALLSVSTAAEGALYNVLINLAGIQDAAYRAETVSKALRLNAEVQERTGLLRAELLGILRSALPKD